jgi:hypothetical protein
MRAVRARRAARLARALPLFTGACFRFETGSALFFELAALEWLRVVVTAGASPERGEAPLEACAVMGETTMSAESAPASQRAGHDG